MNSATAGLTTTCTSPLGREETLRKIETLALHFLESLDQGQDPTMSLTDTSSKNVLRDSQGHTQLGRGRTTTSLFTKKGIGAEKFTRIWQVLALVQRLLLEGKVVTQREAYYILVQHFSNQTQFNHTVQDVVALTGCARSCLGLCASTSGAIAGCVLWKEGSEWIDCGTLASGKRIPGCVDEVCLESVGARFILVVEKDAVFTYLCGQRLWASLPCILLTGCGYPALSVRSLLRSLSDKLHLPVLGLFDYNPHGLRILLTYKHGSARMGLEGHAHTVDIKWLGLHYDDIMTDEHMATPRIDPSSLQPWTPGDERVFSGVQARLELTQDPSYQREARLMNGLHLKAETESLNTTAGLDSLENVIIRKVVRKMYF